MAVEVSEQWGRRLSDKSGDIYYLVTGTDGAATAREAVRAVAPTTLSSMPLDDIEVREIPVIESYTAVARYLKPSGGGGGGEGPPADQFRFDTTGGTEHITLALEHINTYAHPDETEPPTDFQGAIGVNGDSAEGVSIVVPKFAFSVVKSASDSAITATYIGKLYRLTGKVNDGSYSFTIGDVTTTYGAGELLFLGVTGAKNLNTGYWELTFNFAASPNETGLEVGDFTINKGGWEYVWARMEKRVDTDSKKIVAKAVALNVERVYKEGDFDDLGL